MKSMHWRLVVGGVLILIGVLALLNSIPGICLLYTSDAADDLLCVDLGGRRIIKKKNNRESNEILHIQHKNKKPY